VSVGGGLTVYLNWIETGDHSLFRELAAAAFGLQFLPPFLYAGCCSLHPEWLRIECGGQASAGEEGIAIKAFRLKLLLRMAPIFYGISGVLGACGIVVALVLGFGGHPADAFAVAVVSCTLVSHRGVPLSGSRYPAVHPFDSCQAGCVEHIHACPALGQTRFTTTDLITICPRPGPIGSGTPPERKLVSAAGEAAFGSSPDSRRRSISNAW
jgi:hypothetical protein